MLFNVPGGISAEGWPAIVTVPALLGDGTGDDYLECEPVSNHRPQSS
jgi:hypothetical protein